MKRLLAALVAATLLAPIASAPASAGLCNVVANQVTGDGNFVDLDVSGCGYTSTHLRGSYTFAQIINTLGRVVSGIYGNGHYYEVRNLGDNQIGVYVDGTWHSTRVKVVGDGNDIDLQKRGRPSSVDARVLGDGNTLRVRTR